MNRIIEKYQDDLIYIFNQKQLNLDGYDYLVVIKDNCLIETIEGCLIMHYQDDFESYLKFSLPTKMRKTKQLISYNQCKQILDKITYGVLSFNVDDLPYSVGLNHIILNNRIFFHCSKSGFKLNSINKRACYLVVEDLGINLDVGTHNHNSVAIYGRIKEVNDLKIKKDALLQIVASLAPKHPYNDKMLEFTNILELEIDYMIGKSHIR